MLLNKIASIYSRLLVCSIEISNCFNITFAFYKLSVVMSRTPAIKEIHQNIKALQHA